MIGTPPQFAPPEVQLGDILTPAMCGRVRVLGRKQSQVRTRSQKQGGES